jgi:hypothetical protein
MPSAANLVTIVHYLALSAFIGVTSISMLVAVAGRMRLRRPLLTWRRPGSILRELLGPVLFLLLVGGGLGHAWLTGRSVPLAVLMGYPAGGIFWLVATWMLQTVVVTEYGIVPDLSRVHRAVVWSRVVDYFTTTRQGQPLVVVLYRGPEGEHHRLDLPVPRAHAAALREIVERKLRARFSMPDEEIGEEVLDRLDDRIDLS